MNIIEDIASYLVNRKKMDEHGFVTIESERFLPVDKLDSLLKDVTTKAKAEGVTEGSKAGFKKGREKGREEGFEEGREDLKYEIIAAIKCVVLLVVILAIIIGVIALVVSSDNSDDWDNNTNYDKIERCWDRGGHYSEINDLCIVYRVTYREAPATTIAPPPVTRPESGSNVLDQSPSSSHNTITTVTNGDRVTATTIPTRYKDPLLTTLPSSYDTRIGNDSPAPVQTMPVDTQQPPVTVGP